MQHHFHQNVYLFSPEFIFTDLEVKTKEECLKIMSQAMEEKHVVTEDFYDSVMDRESKTTTIDWKWGQSPAWFTDSG